MKSARTLAFLFIGCCLAFASSPGYAEAPADPVAAPETSSSPADAASACLPFAAVVGNPIPLAGCSIVVECDDGGTVSCNGNSSCTTSGPNNRCVTCDGVQQGCCEKTCCEVCLERLNNCLSTCGPFGFPPSCSACYTIYNICVGNCTGGC